MTTPQRFKQAREMLGLSVGQASRFSGGAVSRETIAAIEAGDRAPTQQEVSALARTYRVRPGWLLGEPDPDVSGVLINARGLDRLDDKDIGHLVDLIRARG